MTGAGPPHNCGAEGIAGEAFPQLGAVRQPWEDKEVLVIGELLELFWVHEKGK